MPSQSQLKHLSSLKLSKFRQKYGQFVVEGRKAVEEVFHSRWTVLGIWCTEDFANRHSPNYPYEIMSVSDNKKLSSMETPPGVLAWVETFDFSSDKPRVGAQISAAEGSSIRQFTLALDGISDPGNLGTLIRLADWYGLSSIVASEDTVDVFNPKVLAASMGSFLRVEVIYAHLPDWIKQFPGTAIGADLDGDSIYTCDVPNRTALVIGSESHGIRQEVKQCLNRFVTIPRIGEAESLNAGIAAAIAMDNLLRKMQIVQGK